MSLTTLTLAVLLVAPLRLSSVPQKIAVPITAPLFIVSTHHVHLDMPASKQFAEIPSLDLDFPCRKITEVLVLKAILVAVCVFGLNDVLVVFGRMVGSTCCETR